MKIDKAVITAAGKDQRALPLQRLVDRDGQSKSAVRIIIEEAVGAGAGEIAVVVAPGDSAAYLEACGPLASRVHFIPQPEPRGYGHALWCARDFTAGQPFLHLVSDHLYVSRSAKRCARELVEVAEANDCAVSAVQSTRENNLAFYGAVGGRRVPQQNNLYEIEEVLEKPTPTVAEQRLVIPGLRAGHYLCYFGMHVLTPGVMDLLDTQVRESDAGTPVQLSPALGRIARAERTLALEVSGARYNIGVKYGLLTAQLALALDGADSREVLAQIVELLARQRSA